MKDLKLEQCINQVCPCSGDPVSAESLTLYRNKVVGFCNTGCRDSFDKAIQHFDNVYRLSEISFWRGLV
jgi:hypothetical protein